MAVTLQTSHHSMETQILGSMPVHGCSCLIHVADTKTCYSRTTRQSHCLVSSLQDMHESMQPSDDAIKVYTATQSSRILADNMGHDATKDTSRALAHLCIPHEAFYTDSVPAA